MKLVKFFLTFFEAVMKVLAGYKVHESKFYGVALRLGEALLVAGLVGLMVAGDNINVFEALAIFMTGFTLTLIGIRKKDE